jgi:hypothetical protein
MAVDFPKLGDKLFGQDGDVNLNLHFMRRFWPDRSYINGFHEAANAVAEKMQEDEQSLSNGHMFIGIAYLYRHCIELQLKSIIGLAIDCQVSHVKHKEIMHHNLGRLWADVRRILTENPAGDVEQLDFVESVLQELHKADPGGENFRFAQRRDGSASLATLPVNFSLDQFLQTMESIHLFLDCVSDMFSDWRDALMDMASYYGRG